MKRVGVSTAGVLPTEATFVALRAAGIDATEISVTWNLYEELNYRDIKRFSQEYGVQLWSYHLPFCPFEVVDVCALDKAVREGTVRYFTELIGKASDIGIDKFVVHPSSEPLEAAKREEHLRAAEESLDRLAEIAYRNGAVMVVEDLPRTCLGNTSSEISRLIAVNDKLRVCFDTNHLLTEDSADFVRAVGDKIVTLHMSDYDGRNERHWMPGEGCVDWPRLVEALESVGYDGVWMYELPLAANPTIDRPRDLTFEDFKENIGYLWNKKQPPAIGRPKL